MGRIVRTRNKIHVFLVEKPVLVVGKSYLFYFAVGAISTRAANRKDIGSSKVSGASLRFVLPLAMWFFFFSFANRRSTHNGNSKQ